MSDYFSGRFIDVLDLVKNAKAKKMLDYTKNNKLETITKSLGIEHDNAHTAFRILRPQGRFTKQSILYGGNRNENRWIGSNHQGA
jgi:hypothetical protein